MGCVVNGPGEAADADIGIAGGKGSGMLFKRGEAIKKIKEKDQLIESIYSSRTWKVGRIVTAPWRILKRFLI